MYESYSRQALPSKKYRELLGSAICVFNSNNAFVIEKILKEDFKGNYNWPQLIDTMSGELKAKIKDTITKNRDSDISSLFSEIVDMRNRIVHGFQITDENGNQMLATKIRKSGKQFRITEDYLHEFIKKNQELSELLEII